MENERDSTPASSIFQLGRVSAGEIMARPDPNWPLSRLAGEILYFKERSEQ